MQTVHAGSVRRTANPTPTRHRRQPTAAAPTYTAPPSARRSPPPFTSAPPPTYSPAAVGPPPAFDPYTSGGSVTPAPPVAAPLLVTRTAAARAIFAAACAALSTGAVRHPAERRRLLGKDATTASRDQLRIHVLVRQTIRPERFRRQRSGDLRHVRVPDVRQHRDAALGDARLPNRLVPRTGSGRHSWSAQMAGGPDLPPRVVRRVSRLRLVSALQRMARRRTRPAARYLDRLQQRRLRLDSHPRPRPRDRCTRAQLGHPLRRHLPGSRRHQDSSGRRLLLSADARLGHVPGVPQSEGAQVHDRGGQHEVVVVRGRRIRRRLVDRRTTNHATTASTTTTSA